MKNLQQQSTFFISSTIEESEIIQIYPKQNTGIGLTKAGERKNKIHEIHFQQIKNRLKLEDGVLLFESKEKKEVIIISGYFIKKEEFAILSEEEKSKVNYCGYTKKGKTYFETIYKTIE